MTEHSPEPWEEDKTGGFCNSGFGIQDAQGEPVVNVACYECRGGDSICTEENRRRIMACVNACKGIPSESLQEFMDLVAQITYRLGGNLKPPEVLDNLGERQALCLLTDLIRTEG